MLPAEYEATEAEVERLDALAEALDGLGVQLPCQRPVRMVRREVDRSTGEIADGGQEVLLRCHSRLARVCPSCAALYRGDIAAIMREGIHAARDQGEAIVFVTLTAPSFGRTHFVPPTPPPRLNARRREVWERRYRRRCACGEHHAPGDRRWIGLPATERYDHDAQVRWNAAAGRLWSRTADELTRILGVREAGRLVRLPYVAVAEWQARGAIHLHVIARIPADRVVALEPVVDHARGKGTRRLSRIEREAVAVTTEVDGETIRWGRECVAEVVATERSMVRTAGYLAKVVGYAVKDLTTEAGAAAPHAPGLAEHHQRLDAAAQRLRCGERPTRHARSETEEARQVQWAMCEYDQRDGRPEGTIPFQVQRSQSSSQRRCRSMRHRQWGWRGHTVRRSRSWSALTITECRRRRRQHHADSEGEEERRIWVWDRPDDGLPMQVERGEWTRMQAQSATTRDEACRLRLLLVGCMVSLF